MTRDETVALFEVCEARRGEARAAALAQGKQGDDAEYIAHQAAKAHWNAWAGGLLAKRKLIEARGQWAADKDGLGRLEPKNAETRDWMEIAAVEFSRCLFLPWRAEETKETLGGDEKAVDEVPPVRSIQLENETIDFSGFIFPGTVKFTNTNFSGEAWFTGSTFSGEASFGSATFSGNAWFARANFSGDVSFFDAAFSGAASFEGAIFSDNALFFDAAFSGDTRFVSAAFSGAAKFVSATFFGNVSFTAATFHKSANYWKATFGKETSFIGIKVERAFDMMEAVFRQAPAFNQADFRQAPDLDFVEFPLPLFWPKGDAELIAKYRAIRRMAIQGADYEREQMAFKGELRSRRWTTDKWWHLGTWFGLLYDGLADCGRSIVRPFLIWLASVAVFAVLYLRLADQPEGFSCSTPFIKALFLAGRNALVLFSGGRDARIAQAYRCLYGGDGEPQIPDSVSFLEAFVQVPVSAVLIFLLLLAIKNRFKIK